MNLFENVINWDVVDSLSESELKALSDLLDKVK